MTPDQIKTGATIRQPAHPEYGEWEIEGPAQKGSWYLTRAGAKTILAHTGELVSLWELTSPGPESAPSTLGAFASKWAGKFHAVGRFAHNAEEVGIILNALAQYQIVCDHEAGSPHRSAEARAAWASASRKCLDIRVKVEAEAKEQDLDLTSNAHLHESLGLVENRHLLVPDNAL